MRAAWAAYAAAWIATASCVAVAVAYTGEPGCLWALLLPAFIEIKSRGG